MTTVIQRAQTAARQITADLRGETVTLHNRMDTDDTTEITDAVVSITPPAGVSIGSGKAESSGVLRLPVAHLAAAKQANTVTVRGELWHVLAVGHVIGGRFRCEIAREEPEHSNLFDLNDQQAVWSEA